VAAAAVVQGTLGARVVVVVVVVVVVCVCRGGARDTGLSI
jgi:hypothetical protein